MLRTIGLSCRSFSGKALSRKDLAMKMGNLKTWEITNDGKALRKHFEFKTFNHAWAFMSRTALLAEKMDHHPEWSNVYNMVEVSLTTHDSNGISEKDIKMAEAMDSFSLQS